MNGHFICPVFFSVRHTPASVYILHLFLFISHHNKKQASHLMGPFTCSRSVIDWGTYRWQKFLSSEAGSLSRGAIMGRFPWPADSWLLLITPCRESREEASPLGTPPLLFTCQRPYLQALSCQWGESEPRTSGGYTQSITASKPVYRLCLGKPKCTGLPVQGCLPPWRPRRPIPENQVGQRWGCWSSPYPS